MSGTDTCDCGCQRHATCWDYAPLIDVFRRVPGLDAVRFTGRTASEWLAGLQHRCSSDEVLFERWYEAVVLRFLHILSRHPRVPDNHYCIELAVPPLVSILADAILGLGLKRASVGQWLATLLAFTGEGIKPEDLEESENADRVAALFDAWFKWSKRAGQWHKFY